MLRAARLLTRQRPRKAQSRSQHLLVLLRHGQSEWNASKRFTGWVDVDLTEQGREEATHAGIMLKRHGFEFDEAHTSLLKRAVRTLWSALHCCDQHWIPVRRSWRLNERHYGALTGMSKQEVKDQMVCLGAEYVTRPRRWRLHETTSPTWPRECETRSRRWRDHERETTRDRVVPRRARNCSKNSEEASTRSRSACGRTTPSGRGGIGAINIWGPTPCPRGNRCGCARNGSCRTGSTTSCRRCGGGNASSSRRTIIH